MNEKIQVSAWGIRHNLGGIALSVRNAEGALELLQVTQGENVYGLAEIPGHLKLAFGVTAMEIPDSFLLDASEAELDAFREALAREGVTLSTVTIDRNAIGEANDTWRAEDLQWVKESLRISGSVGAKRARVNIFPPPIVPEIDHAPFDVVVDTLKDLVVYSAEQGVRLMIENHCELTNTPEKIEKLLAAVPGLGLIIDTGNIGVLSESVLASRLAGGIPEFVKDPEPAFAFVRTMLPRADLVHVKTYGYSEDGASYLYDIDKVIGMINDSPYKGPVTIECASFIPAKVYDAIERTVKKLDLALA